MPADRGYDLHREVWNAAVDRRPAVIARCTSADDVAAAIRFGRDAGIEIAVKCGGHSVLGLCVPAGGLMIDLTPMDGVRVDTRARRAWVQGGALLRGLDRTALPHGLATTAGNVSHTGVGGLTLGGGMGWLARQFGLACDNVEAFTVVTADGETVRATATENAELFWGLRGGGGNFGVVTEFEFQLHPTSGRALVVALYFGPDEAAEALRVWRELLPDAPRAATLTADVMTASGLSQLPIKLEGRTVASIGYVWIGDMNEARAYLRTIRQIGQPLAENITEMSYVELQSIADERHRHGRRRYSKGHYFTELSDGAIADVKNADSAFDHRGTLVEWGGATNWVEPGEDAERIAAARAYGAAMEPFASGIYVNTIADEGSVGVQRAYGTEKLRRLASLKERYDPENVFHLNHNIRPSTSGK